MKLKKFAATMLTMVCVLSLAACGDSQKDNVVDGVGSNSAKIAHDLNGDGKLVIYGIYKSGDQTWFLNEGAAAEATVKAAGGEFYYVDVQTDGQKELDAINTAIANKADGIVTCTPDQTMSANIVSACK